MNKLIYADHAATTPMDEEVLELQADLQKKYFANASSSYKLARPVKKILNEAREKIAACINASPGEIFFTSGGTESNNWALKSQSKPSHVITSAVEHKSILNACRALEKSFGCRVTKLPVNKFGEVNPEDLQKEILPETEIISIMLANNEVGTIQPIKELAEIAHERGKIFHTDAVQALGHIPIDVRALAVDFLSASAHKFNGPKGIGFLFIRSGLKLAPFHDGGLQEFKLRAGTENFSAIAAMALALEKNCADMKENIAKVSACAKSLVEGLNGIDFRLNGGDNRLPGLLSLSFRNFDGEMLLHRLDLKNICVSTGSACNSREKILSHVLEALKIPNDYAQGTIRISFGKNNSTADARKISSEILTLVQQG